MFLGLALPQSELRDNEFSVVDIWNEEGRVL